MKRYAAQKIQLSQSEVLSNSFVELSDDGEILRTGALVVGCEAHSTQFVNGWLLPFTKEKILTSGGGNIEETVGKLFAERGSYGVGDRVAVLTAVSGRGVFAGGKCEADVVVNEIVRFSGTKRETTDEKKRISDCAV